VVDGAGLARDQAPEETLAKDPDRLARRQTLRRVEAMEWAASRRHLDLIAAIATIALKVGVWFRRGRLVIVSADSPRAACPWSGSCRS
jgi:hypothetical protein